MSPERYRVTWRVDDPVPVTTEVEGYEDLGVTFGYRTGSDDGPELLRVVHDFRKQAPHIAAEDYSNALLSGLWAFLQFHAVKPFRVVRERALVFQGDRVGLANKVAIGLSSTISQSVPLPDEYPLAGKDPRLRDWLMIANDAHHSTSDVHAVRSYYTVLEELLGPECVDECVRWTRHLLSHGEPLTHPKALAYLHEKLGVSGPVQYQPIDPGQAALAAEARKQARELVTALLKERLDPS